MGWTESIKWGVKTSAIVHVRVRDDVEKQLGDQQQNDEEHRKMKNNNTGGSLRQSTIGGSF